MLKYLINNEDFKVTNSMNLNEEIENPFNKKTSKLFNTVAIMFVIT